MSFEVKGQTVLNSLLLLTQSLLGCPAFQAQSCSQPGCEGYLCSRIAPVLNLGLQISDFNLWFGFAFWLGLDPEWYLWGSWSIISCCFFFDFRSSLREWGTFPFYPCMFSQLFCFVNGNIFFQSLVSQNKRSDYLLLLIPELLFGLCFLYTRVSLKFLNVLLGFSFSCYKKSLEFLKTRSIFNNPQELIKAYCACYPFVSKSNEDKTGMNLFRNQNSSDKSPNDWCTGCHWLCCMFDAILSLKMISSLGKFLLRSKR